jgi:hypothetical protein
LSSRFSVIDFAAGFFDVDCFGDTTIVCDNGSYAILQHELLRVGAASDGKRAGQLLDLGEARA